MDTIDIKPLSVNKAWQGRRFKTKEYKQYFDAVYYLLPQKEPLNGKLKLDIVFGFSNSRMDIDNPVKLFIDILQKKYQFDDSQIYRLSVNKNIVKKGKEYIKFEINPFLF